MLDENEILERANQLYHEAKTSKYGAAPAKAFMIQSDQVKALLTALVEHINRRAY